MLPLKERTSIPEGVKFSKNEEEFIKLLSWEVKFEYKNEKRQRAETSDLFDKIVCIRLNNTHALAVKVTTVPPVHEARAGVTALIEGCGPRSVIDPGWTTLIPTGRSLLDETMLVPIDVKFQKYPTPIASSESSLNNRIVDEDEPLRITISDSDIFPYAKALHAGSLQTSCTKTDPFTFLTVSLKLSRATIEGISNAMLEIK